MVWLAAELSGIKGCFREYAVLGDDVVIAHLQVAQSYEKLLGMMGLSISKENSGISHYGALEFAKKFWVKSVQEDLSPVSMRSLLTVRSTLGLSFTGLLPTDLPVTGPFHSFVLLPSISRPRFLCLFCVELVESSYRRRGKGSK